MSKISATVLSGAKNPTGGAQFVKFLISSTGQDLVKTYHFLPGTILVGGDKSAVPGEVTSLAKGDYKS
jgi:ABC-type Fe3+ transport system substrate-binding protein